MKTASSTATAWGTDSCRRWTRWRSAAQRRTVGQDGERPAGEQGRGPDHELAVLEEVKAGPGHPWNLVVEQRRRGGTVCRSVICLGDQLFELFRNSPVSFESSLIVHRHLFNS